MLQLQCWLISLKFKYGEDSRMKLTWFESWGTKLVQLIIKE